MFAIAIVTISLLMVLGAIGWYERNLKIVDLENSRRFADNLKNMDQATLDWYKAERLKDEKRRNQASLEQ